MRRLALLVVAVGVVASAVAVWLFPRAFPIVALEQSLTRDAALARGDSFFTAHALAPAGARTAVRFRRDDSLRTYIELAGGGHDSLNALVAGDDVAPYAWSVRAFVPDDPREARVDFAPDGRVIGFERKLAEADTLPEVTPDSGRRLAEQALGTWIGERLDRWTLVSSSYVTRKTSGRVDRTYTFERSDRRIAGAPIRTDVVVAGNAPSELRRYVKIPESFSRRYAEMRSWNEALALLASLGILAVAIAGIVALTRFARQRQVRWQPAIVVGGIIGAFMVAAGLNELPGSWFHYDTAVSPTTFQLQQVLGAISLGVATAFLVGFTLAAAEVATRHAFPRHLDWWKLWRHRGTREVAASVGGGYVVAAIAFAYVVTFYLATRTLFGWWVPSELLDDPNQMASPMPWVSGIAISMQAAVWEEALFRALPLSLLSLWIGQRAGRKWWMAAGVVVTALVFGFAHANYESWPPYSRGVEIFLDAAFWGVLFLAFGLLVTIVAHFVYDAVLFGIFAAQGDAVEYRVTAAIILLALLAPALVVLWRRVRQGSFTAAPDDARFAAWAPGAEEAVAAPPAPTRARVFTGRARLLAVAAAAAGVVMAVGAPKRARLGPEFTARRGQVMQVADSMLRAHGGNPAGWRRLTTIGRDTLDAWPRFLHEHRIIPEAQRLAATYHPATWWAVRYVHTAGTTAQRAEEWIVRVWPDGRPLDARHVLPDSARRDSVDTAAARRIAKVSLAGAGVDTLVLRETNVEETARPARRDMKVTYTDTSVKLPAGAAARAWVQLAGNEPLVARRGIELPESFLRADLKRRTNGSMIAGMCMLAFASLVITGIVFVKRRRPELVHDGALNRRTVLLGLVALTALMILGGLNELPSQLYSYDTAEPWNTFLGVTALGFLTTVVGALFAYGMWLVLSSMRRRAGVPMLASAPSKGLAVETLTLGAGIGGILYATGALVELAARGGVPRTPETLLNALVPALATLAELPWDVIGGVALLGIPLLVVAAITPRWPLRALIGAMMLGLLIAAGMALDTRGDADPGMAAIALLATLASAAALMIWGAHSAWAWIVAALAYAALGALRVAVYGPLWEVRGAGVLTFVAALAIILLIARRLSGSSAAPAEVVA